MKFRFALFLVFVMALHSNASALQSIEDSLLSVIKNAKSVEDQLKNYAILAYKLDQNNNQKAEYYYEKAIKIAEKELAKKEISQKEKNKLYAILSELYNDYGYTLKGNSNYKKSIIHYQKSIELQKLITDSIDESDIATTMVNIGNALLYLEDIPNALNYFFEADKIYSKIKDEEGIAFVNKYIAKVYFNTDNYVKAQLYVDKVVEMLRKLDLKKGLAHTLVLQASIYKKQAKNKEAESQLIEAFSLFKTLENVDGMAEVEIDIGNLYEIKNNLDSALYFYKRAIDRPNKNLNQISISNANYHIGLVLYKKNKYQEALKYSLTSYTIAKDIGLVDKQERSAHLLANIYSKLGNYSAAFNMQKIYEKMHDSLNITENNKKIIQKQFQFEYDKKTVADSIKSSQQKQILELQLAKQKSQKNYLFGILFLIVVFTFFVYNRLQITRKQRNIISDQKAIVDEKQKEIVDSITYAKRIQQAILPNHKFIDEKLSNYFILYKPKDIVAGDFYWVAESQHNIDSKLYVAVCDCTGHGVPGAMVSVICNNALNRALIEFGETMPGKIFDKARLLILENFAKSDEEVKDGMDASLAVIDFANNKMFWSGANIPLWIIRNNTSINNFELIEIKPDKQPIGKGYHPSPFVTHEISLQKNDAIYLFSDGYADQFGGEKNKKITKAKFKEILLEAAHLNMKEQQIALHDFYVKHKGNYEQIDDVCVIGIRV
jgi:serine phosphatase RsbU (regulator of sigma subunit)/tetratricopeptide (TPR) repeat protein